MKLFISHSSVDKWVARQLSHLLEESGHQTFLDEKDIKTGDSIDSSIQTSLQQSDALLLLLSPASIKSQWVLIELGGAKALSKRIVPILLHVGSNEVPAAISQLLARDINEFEVVLTELSGKARPKLATRTSSKVKDVSGYAIGDRVRIVAVEHLTDEDRLASPKWVDGMDKFSGVITEVTGFSKSGNNLLLAADGGDFRWSPRWVSRAA